MAEDNQRRPIDPKVLDRLDRSTTDILAELRQLRGALARRPTRHESRVRTRLAAVLLAVGIVTAIQVHDGHVEHCSPGARSARGIDYFANATPETFSYQELQRQFNQSVPDLCDVTFPTHSHSPGDHWPTTDNWAGLALYVTLAGAGVAWLILPMRRRKHEKVMEGALEDDRLERVLTEQNHRRKE